MLLFWIYKLKTGPVFQKEARIPFPVCRFDSRVFPRVLHGGKALRKLGHQEQDDFLVERIIIFFIELKVTSQWSLHRLFPHSFETLPLSLFELGPTHWLTILSSSLLIYMPVKIIRMPSRYLTWKNSPPCPSKSRLFKSLCFCVTLGSACQVMKTFDGILIQIELIFISSLWKISSIMGLSPPTHKHVYPLI